MANRIRKKKSNNFTKIANSMLNDKKLSWTARGILAYMLSKPDDRSFNNTDLENRSDKDGRTVVENAKKELKELKYLIIEKNRDSKGKIGYDRHISDEPLTGFPCTDKPSTGTPCTDEPLTENLPYSKIRDSKTDIITPKGVIQTSGEEKEIVEEEKKEYGNSEINELLKHLMQKARSLGIAYDKTDERNFARHILNAEQFGEITMLTKKSRIDSAVAIMELSMQYGGDYPAGGPKKIYQRASTIINAYILEAKKQQTKDPIQKRLDEVSDENLKAKIIKEIDSRKQNKLPVTTEVLEKIKNSFLSVSTH